MEVFEKDYYNFIKDVKGKIIEAIYEDDELAEILTLKGGTLLDMIWKISGRPSVDIDLSIDQSVEEPKISEIGKRLEVLFEQKFLQGINGKSYKMIDFVYEKRPKKPGINDLDFWGGYKVEFKLVETNMYNSSNDNENRKNAVLLGKKKQGTLTTKFTIDFSHTEICDEYKEGKNYGTVTAYVYTPTMVVCEKIRAICQQNKKYAEVLGKEIKEKKARTKDFYDIYKIMNEFKLDLTTPNNIELLKLMFDIKKVPLEFLKEVRNFYDYYSNEFKGLLGTLPKGEAHFSEFEPYFNYVVNLINQIVKEIEKG